MALSDAQRAAIRTEFAAFLRRRIDAARSRVASDDDVNPFLTAVLGPRLMADMRVHQTFERGVVTSFGGTLQKIARLVAGPGSGSGTGGADLELTTGGHHYFVQIKSGPKTVNKDIAEAISANLNSARARYDAGAVGVLGVCFGTLAQLNKIARPELERRGIEVWIGRDFWTQVGHGDESTYDQLLEIAAQASVAGAELQPLFEEKVAEMSAALDHELEREAE